MDDRTPEEMRMYEHGFSKAAHDAWRAARLAHDNAYGTPAARALYIEQDRLLTILLDNCDECWERGR